MHVITCSSVGPIDAGHRPLPSVQFPYASFFLDTLLIAAPTYRFVLVKNVEHLIMLASCIQDEHPIGSVRNQHDK